MSEKLISILMPVKNPGKYLKPCILSILQQSYKNWELVCVNDHSTDGSDDLLRTFEGQEHRIKVFDNKGNGIIDALRLAYINSSGGIIHRMDADDLMPEHKIKWMYSVVEPGKVVSGMVKYFSDDWMVGLGFQNYQDWLNRNMEEGKIWEDMYMECPIPSAAWMITRQDLDAIGAFNSDLIPEDYDLCFRMRKGGLLPIAIKKTLHLWRDSQSRTSRKDPRYFPMSYYPLKVEYFLTLDRVRTKPLVLWGAGKKGKLIAELLLKRGEEFIWHTDNQNKWGRLILEKELVNLKKEEFKDKQIILAVSSPDSRMDIEARLKDWSLRKAFDFWWFC